MMWSTFLVADEEGRAVGPAATPTVGAGAHVSGGGGGAQGMGGLAGLMSGRTTFGGNKRRRTGHAMTEAQEGKIKLAFFVAIVGVILTVLGVGTEFWAELAPPKSFYGNQTCPAVHFGLWKCCTKTLWVADIDPERESCGPAELPGESNCTYFKFFTTGENAVMFHKTTQKNLNVAAAMLSVFSLVLMVMGSICISMALSKEIAFFLKPASVCFILAAVGVVSPGQRPRGAAAPQLLLVRVVRGHRRRRLDCGRHPLPAPGSALQPLAEVPKRCRLVAGRRYDVRRHDFWADVKDRRHTQKAVTAFDSHLNCPCTSIVIVLTRKTTGLLVRHLQYIS
ncbi:voltage-dependent calcium channel gamma-6 subunit-like isoform X1 [Phyllopteryx taeniolatus]|uniref:voltage-dependent calcium channel gamma-6 subunit-like isoform X1 n=1 Tax=Phyllopteryx taeniolatus TaxID=161469 RepID=UPI002AD27C6A|nr:voltage-dependent calcium channel gamma-6 subunit-like isoform X1 [Phyllopteryx taeniolatus]